jgi:GNAT superfamily N-acetyltransferase
MIRYLRTDSTNPDFQGLVRLLDGYLEGINGEEHSFYAAFNGIALLKHAVVAYRNDAVLGDIPVGCGAVKLYAADDSPFPKGTMEIKRMFVREDVRGQGIAHGVLRHLEEWAKETGAPMCVLETSTNLAPAIRLYEQSGYARIPNYGQYVGAPSSVCMQKTL